MKMRQKITPWFIYILCSTAEFHNSSGFSRPLPAQTYHFYRIVYLQVGMCWYENPSSRGLIYITDKTMYISFMDPLGPCG